MRNIRKKRAKIIIQPTYKRKLSYNYLLLKQFINSKTDMFLQLTIFYDLLNN